MKNTNLTAANEARKEKSLDKLWNFSDYGISSFRELIDKGVFVKSESKLVPQLQYNRIKYNRMNNFREQEDYYKKCTEKTKLSYSLYYSETVSTEVSKFVFDYFNETQKKDVCIDCGQEINDMNHNYGTEDFICCLHCYNDAQEVKQLLKM